MAIWLKLRAYLYGLIAAAGLLLAAWWVGSMKGKQAGEADAQAARNDAANAKARADQLEARHDTDAKVARLPEGPVVAVDAAPDGTAAGELRRNWLRD